MPKQFAKRRRDVEAEAESADEISAAPPKARKRKHQDNDHEDESRTKRPKPDFSSLKPKTRKVPQEVIRSDWRTLPEPAQRQVQEVLLAAKRTALNAIRDPKRRREAESVLDAMHRKLEKRLPRSPFPPSSKASHFSLENTLDRIRSLEAEQIPAVDSVKLLEEEIEREELRIEQKRQLLEELEENAKSASQKRKKRAKATHPLLQDSAASQYADDAESIALATGRTTPPVVDEADEDLAPLLSQFRSHLESIQANGLQLKGVGDAITSAQASLGTLSSTI